jgi:hypothetical protein
MAHNHCATMAVQGGIEFNQACVDEFHAAIGAWKVRKNIAVKHKHAYDFATAHERVMQGRVIEIAQISAEPDQGNVELRHL